LSLCLLHFAAFPAMRRLSVKTIQQERINS
jgi:hypothetical protein